MARTLHNLGQIQQVLPLQWISGIDGVDRILEWQQHLAIKGKGEWGPKLGKRSHKIADGNVGLVSSPRQSLRFKQAEKISIIFNINNRSGFVSNNAFCVLV